MPGFLVALGAVFAALAMPPLSAQVVAQRYEEPGSHTFTVPVGVSEITVQAWGGGGRGGPASGNGRNFAGGGGGGALASSTLPVTAGQVFDLRVGAGSSSAGAGEISWFGDPALLRAAGGESVPTNDNAGGVGGQAANSIGDVTFDGGTGGQARGRSAGGGGSSAGTGQPGNDAGGSAGATAPAGGGDGGDGSTSDNGAGQAGEQPGGGGGGATSFFDSFDGGAGGDGLVVVRYTLPPAELIAEYRMEQADWTGATGEVSDDSGNGRDATPVGGATTAVTDPALPGNPGTCRYGEFDGIDDGVDQPGAWLEGLPAVTVMAWVYNAAPLSGNDRGVFFTGPTGPGRDNRLGMRYDTVGFFGGGSNVIKASISTTACPDDEECVQIETDSGLMARDRWQHLAMTWQTGGELKVYVDGVRAGTTAELGQGTGGVIDAVSALNIAQGAKGARWQGRIDEFRVFRGALTASEIDDWRNRTFPCDAIVPEHIRLLHPATGLTCRPESITVQACADAACASLLSEEVTVTLTSPAGNWSVDPVTFTGSTIVSLLVPSPGTVMLDAVSDPEANSPTRCFAGGTETCLMEWFDTGFVIDAPDHVAATNQTVSIAAVRTDDASRSCAPAFAGETRTIGFWSGYANPASGTLPVALEGTAIAGAAPGTGIDVAFDGSGTGMLSLAYPDAGEMLLRARYEGTGQEAGLVMIGSDAFVTRPAGFDLEVPGNPGAAGAAGPVFTSAGTPFEVTVTAHNAAGDATPNFGRETPAESVALESALLAPTGGASPPLGGNFGPFGEDCEGNAAAAGTACGRFSWPEVGIVEPLPRLADGTYLGTADVVGPPGAPLGRFIPAYFTLDGATLVDRVEVAGCASPFTYFGERIGLDWLLGARSAAGSMTTNYAGDFAKLGVAGLGLGGNEPLVVDVASITWTAGSGAAAAEVHVERDAPREPLDDFRVGTAPVDGDGVVLAAPDVDLDDDGVDDHGLIGATSLRYGRLRIENAVGSELGPLVLPVTALEFRDSTWQPNVDDDCTALSLADEVGLVSSGGDDADGTATVSVGGGTTSIQEADPVTLAAGEAGFTFSAPGAVGWVDLTLLLGDRWPFLRDDLDDDGGHDDDPQARAAFGLFDGDPNRILLQEIDPR
ncbi:MAG: LamG domain-containing protein [Wenzhouxiangellaceae bacterium]|nr:LamG domain-containing protein [Wenzhouxiangellaceae bacterium]